MKSIGVLFDLDGVLIDSESEYTKVWSEVNRRFPSQYPDLAHRIKGMTLDNIIAIMPLPDSGIVSGLRFTNLRRK